MTSRRNLFKVLACAVGMSAMEVCGLAPAAAVKPPVGCIVVSAPVCLADARNALNFQAQIQNTINNLVDALPSKTGYRIQWVNVYDKAENPHQNTGHFWAVPDATCKTIDWKQSGFISEFLSQKAR